jgi:hypothetical protein
MSTDLKSDAPFNVNLPSLTSDEAKTSSDTPVTMTNSPIAEEAGRQQDAKPPETHYPLSFWLCFAGLCGTGLISGLDSTVLSTSLPTIIDDLDGGSNYVWVVNVYFLTW